MTEKGEVRRDHVIDILRSKDVEVTLSSQNPENQTETYVIQGNGNMEVQTFGAYVSRRTLHYLERKFKVPISLFFNLGTVPGPVKPAIAPPSKSA